MKQKKDQKGLYFFSDIGHDQFFRKVSGSEKFEKPTLSGPFYAYISEYKDHLPYFLELCWDCLLFRKSKDGKLIGYFELYMLQLKQTQGEVKGKKMSGLCISNKNYRHEFFSENESLVTSFFEHMKKFCLLVKFRLDFETIKVISQGINSKLFHIRKEKTSEEFAVKVFDKKSLENDLLQYSLVRNEILMMRLVDSEYVIRLHELYEGENYLYAVMEYIRGKRLFDYIREARIFSERHALYVIKQVLLGLKHLHDRGLIHRDIKLENIMFRSSEKHAKVALIDLGFCVRETACMALTPQCGTPGYTAPEILRLEKYNRKVDVYSAGIVFYMM